MMHHKNFRKFGREKNQRKAFIKGLASSLIIHGRMETTIARAKEVRPYVEKLITMAKVDSVANRRHIAAKLYNHDIEVNKLFTELGPKYKDVNGGYTRIIRLSRRLGDGAEMAIIEFV